MKKVIVAFLLACLTSNLLAQQHAVTTIRRDTINLRGYVYDYKGKPIPYLFMESAQKDYTYNEFKAWARTDTSGYFEIKGAKLNDTVKFRETLRYGAPVYYNRDSRYLVIYLPPDRILDLNTSSPLQVVEKRKNSKVMPQFKLQILEGGDYFPDLIRLPHYKNGNEEFLHIINNHIKYPELAVNYNIEGTVEIGFTVERDGSLVDLKILKGIGYGCDESVVNAFKIAPHWQPGIENGRPIAMKATVSVQFKLTDK